jgi:citrate lyase subunit beta/citryl-CoA lyase
MTPQVFPRRSALYVPAINARAVTKARELPADVIILDLEDSVAVDQKELARRQCVEAIRIGGYGPRELIVRINGSDTPWHEADLEAAMMASPAGILLPKVESPESILHIAQRMETVGTPSHTKLWCMLETPRGVLAANEILQCHFRLTVAVMGTSDLTRDLRAQHTALRLPLLASLSLCLLAARAHGIAILDGVHLDLEDEGGFGEICRQGRELGFDGKTLIHPRQIALCNTAYSPTLADVELAQAIIASYVEARERGQGVTVVGGRLVEAMHVAEAQRVLALHQALLHPDRADPTRRGNP